MKKYFFTLLILTLSLSASAFTNTDESQSNEKKSEISALKDEIVSLAESYQGQADPDGAKQESLRPLVEELIALNPQKPVEERLELLVGNWHQVWGPYDYGFGEESLVKDEIYQSISPEGFYYNVAPFKFLGEDRVGILKGEYGLSSEENTLNVEFLTFKGLVEKPEEHELWELAYLFETEKLNNVIPLLPDSVVQNFFSKGTLREVYTDEDIRILYGSSNSEETESIYVMERVWLVEGCF